MKKYKAHYIVLYILFSLLFFIALFFYISYNNRPRKPRQIEHSYIAFNDWELIHDDGSREKITLPTKINCKNDSKVVMEAVLPENLTEADWINFSNGYDIDLYIDGELRKTFRESDVDLPGGVVKGIKQFCHLSHEDSGKVIRMERPNFLSYSSAIMIGDSLGLVSRYLLQGAGTYLSTVFLIIVSFVVVIFGIIVRILKQQDSSLIALGFGVFLGALWLLFDSPMYQFVFDNYYIDGDMSFIMATLMAFPFLLCVDALQNRMHSKLNLILGFILVTNSIITCGLHFSGTLDFEETLIASDIVISFVVACFLITLIIDTIKKRIEDVVQVYGLFVALTCGFIEIILIVIDPIRVDGPFILLGLWVALIAAVVQQIVNIWRGERERQRAIQANEAKTEFLAKISHEIRTPINAVLGMDEMILRESGNNTINQYAADIKVAANNLLSIINEILDSSKIESGKMEIIPANYKISAMLNDLYNMIYVKAEEKKLKLSFKIDESIPSEYYGDDVRIKQVLVNLLTNAVKYTVSGEVKLTLTMKKVGDKAILHFSVIDTGIGIKEKDIDALFSAYQRIDEKHNRYVEGTGLGMSITTQLLKLMGSQLKVESTYGKGSTFSFKIEQGIVNETPLGDFRKDDVKHVEADEVMNYTAEDAKILIVDDNKTNRKVFSYLLKKVKVQITEASSGMECLENICKEKYDIIFLDHMMPEMDGIETLQKMKVLSANQNQETPVIMFTANAIKGAKEYFQENGANGYLTKPVKLEELDKIFTEYLDSSMIKYNN